MNSVGKAEESIEDMIQILGSGSDHSIFSFYAGVPSIYFRFQPDTHKYPGKILTVIYATDCPNMYNKL
jgi:hypothetical protein